MLEEILDESAASASQSSDNLLTVDCGATGSLLSMSTLALWEQGNLAKVRKIDPEVRKRYRVANGEVVTTDSQATVLFTQHPGLGPIEFDLTEQEGVPSLLGMNFLNNATLNLERCLLIKGGQVTKLQRQQNGHLTVPLKQPGTQIEDGDPSPRTNS